MSCGPLPPVPGLIPISALRKSPSCNNNDLRECTPCAAQKEVMGEQRSRRPGSQPSVDLIDIARRSRAPQAPSPSGKTTHRKSDRRRERRGGRKRSASKRREPSPEEKCVNPRVNPIFVWVRQEDTHIVDVKCEDYDKRNRIVLTKTAQGWRAIPRTETLVPNLRAAAPDDDDAKHQRKARKSGKVKRKSTAVQVDDDDVLQRMDVDDPAWSEPVNDPAWSEPVNIESHLPSHTIQVHRKRSPSPANVNTSADHDYTAQASAVECSVSKVCDVSPLDNLLAVAELEFNQQIQTEAWCEAEGLKTCEPKDFDVSIELISKTEAATLHDLSSITQSDNFDSDGEKDDCDYNEEDENNLAMDDILTRLEQSLQSPDALCTEITESIMETETEEDPKPDATQVPDDSLVDQYTMEKEEEEADKPDNKEDLVVGSSTSTEAEVDKPTDLSTSKKVVECLTITLPDDDLMPTDLSVPKKKARSPSPRPISPRPSSRCSETIQSPQPSGLPAVPHSPDVQTTNKSAYLESLLSSTSQKISLNSEVTITVKEPLDFGKCRKSASPTVTCSEEVNTCSSSTSKDGEPETKKGRLDDITLRTILDANSNQPAGKEDSGKNRGKSTAPETSRLLELLTSEAEPDALTQLKQLYSDSNVNLPDPMLIPKDRLSQILMSPGKEIPRLLAQRPELRLPEALAFPHLLQDPDILVITLAQLETIIRKQTGLPLPVEKPKSNNNSVSGKKTSESEANVKTNEKEKAHSKPQREHSKQGTGQAANKDSARMNELCNDINLASNNALNQMMWLPYLHQLEVAAMAFGNGADFLKMLSSAFPPYSNQVPDVAQMFPLNRFPQPPGFANMQPLQNSNFNNPFEFPIWHESAPHSNLPQRSAANQFERHCNKNAYREYMSGSKSHQSSSHKYSSASKPFSPAAMFQQNNPSMHGMPPFVNVPAAYQPNMRPNLQIPQFSSILTQKNPLYSKSNGKTSPTLTTCDPKMASLYRGSQRYSYNQKLGSLASSHKAKAPFNPLEGLQKSLAQEGFKKSADFATQPMDLSGSGAPAGKSRLGKQNFCDSVNLAKSLKFDDVPEVGSTTASIEDMTAHMQDSQKHLWHPLFGNQKSSSNPWNWSTVTATGE